MLRIYALRELALPSLRLAFPPTVRLTSLVYPQSSGTTRWIQSIHVVSTNLVDNELESEHLPHRERRLLLDFVCVTLADQF